MSLFDEAFKREQERRGAEVTGEKAAAASAVRAADRAVPLIRQIIHDFARHLSAAGVKTVRVEVGASLRLKKSIFGRDASQYVRNVSPPGWVVSSSGWNHGSPWLTLITPDAQLWKAGWEYVPGDDEFHRKHTVCGYVQIDAEAVARGVSVAGEITVALDGTPVIEHRYDDSSQTEPFADVMARSAQGIIAGQGPWVPPANIVRK